MVMNASSSDGCRATSSCRTMPLRGGEFADRRRLHAGDGQAPSPAASTVAPCSRSNAASALGLGRADLHVPGEAERTNWATLVSASSRPRPMTMRWSAVSAISLIRWLETNTVRPSAARERSRLRIQPMPSGSSPLTGSSSSSTRRVAEQGGGDAEALAPCPARTRRRGGRPPRPGRPGRAPRRPGAAPIPLAWASASRWLRALRPGWTALASSRAPTSCSGRRSSR